MAGRKRLHYEAFDDTCEEWVKKCIKCKHHYVKTNDIDAVYCSAKKECHFDEIERIIKQ